MLIKEFIEIAQQHKLYNLCCLDLFSRAKYEPKLIILLNVLLNDFCDLRDLERTQKNKINLIKEIL